MTQREQDHRRPPRRLFFEPPRSLARIYFYTSSIEKYLQARLVFDQHGLTVDYFKSKTDPYDEDYGGTTTDLLTRAIAQVTEHVGSGQLVFVEDTSVRIEALSGAKDMPGMQIKQWFQETTFADLDIALREAGGDRRAIVKSDIALKLPGLDRALLFHGETRGSIAPVSPQFSGHPQYPWLTPETFNGWFVPDGVDLPLGALSLDESLPLDFRVRSFEQLIDRLEEYAAALNLPASAYRTRRTPAALREQTPSLFSTSEASLPPALLVVGRTCAGKTTFAEYASGRHGLLYIEASALVRSLQARPGVDDRDAFAFAKRTLDELGHDIVGKEIVRRYGDKLDGPFVVSGLRDIDEVRYLQGVVPRARLALVEASERTRFERHVRRARAGAETTLAEFRERDTQQDAFGLLPVVDDLAEIRIVNEGNLHEYQRQVDAVIAYRSDESGVDLAAHPRHRPAHHQLYRCLKILAEAKVALQCDQVEALSSELGRVGIRHNNANKVLKLVPALARRLDPPDGTAGDQDSARVRYEITSAGRTYLFLLERREAQFLSQESDS
jgi:inosine/xanthosine triphosphate pyrophosphatase family protein/dephospho-CoA kinase